MRPLNAFRAAFAGLIAAVLVATPLHAQVLRGTVRDSASRAPISGAVLVFLDSSGNSIGRNITNEQGRFAIAMDRTMRRIQVLRIGFRPRTVSVPVSASAELEIMMPSVPTLLEIVNVVDQPNCPRRPDRPAAFALWEQARAALLATVVARETNPANVLRLHFTRRVDRDEHVASQAVTIDSTSTSQPFIASRSAAEFVARGFSYDSARSTWYHGPDAEVMLHDAFARGYCFRVADADRNRTTQVGIAFAPANRQRGRVDIDGVVWIDTASRSLADILFRYVGTSPQAARIRPGGRISFRAMENGTVMIDRWFLRTPTVAPTQVNLRSYIPTSGVVEARETGGEVARARWPDGREWRASLGRVRGTVIGNGGAGTELRLIDTDYRAVVDSAGRFEISNLLPGPYSIGATDSTVAAIDLVLVAQTRFIAIRDSTVALTVDVPTARDYAAGMCRADAGAMTNAIVVARVVLDDGSPAAGADVDVHVVVDGNFKRIVSGETDSNGLFHICRAPRNARLQLRATSPLGRPAQIIAETARTIVAVKLQLKPLKE